MYFSRRQHKLRCLGAFRRIVRGPSPRISRVVDARERFSRNGTEGCCVLSPATNLLVGQNSTVIPNNYLQVGREAKAFLHTRVRAHRLLSGYIWPSSVCAGEGSAKFGTRLHFACRAVCPH